MHVDYVLIHDIIYCKYIHDLISLLFKIYFHQTLKKELMYKCTYTLHLNEEYCKMDFT